MWPIFWRIRVLLMLVSLSVAVAQQEAHAPLDKPGTTPGAEANSDPLYHQLRAVGLSGQTAEVKNLTLQREAATFTFVSGKFSFLAPVNGKVTGAVFVGEGSMTLVPPTANEKQAIALLTKSDRLEDSFNQILLRFTDGTYEEIKKAGTVTTDGHPEGGAALNDANSALRNKMKVNLHARILQDVLSERPGSLFVAFPKTQKYGKLVYAVDPFPGSLSLTRGGEEVILLSYDDAKWGEWCSFHYSDEYGPSRQKRGHPGDVVRIEDQNLDIEIEKSGRLQGTAVTSFTSRWDGLRVLPLHMFPTLRVQSVTDIDGHALAFIQEDKEKDAQFAVVLPKPLMLGETFKIRTTYGGSDAVRNEGSGNYYPVARTNWYPNTDMQDYATYTMRFRIPKGLQMVATGVRVSETTEGDRNISVWKSEGPQTVAGFNFGQFKRLEAKLDKLDYVVESYANQEEPDILKRVTGTRMYQVIDPLSGKQETRFETGPHSLTNASMMQKALAEGQLAVQLYTDYFGPTPFHRLAMTQQTATNYGQSWPELVFLPITYFFDSTMRHQVGLDDPRGYFTVVGPHEIAHQWWGHTVGWPSYRDQWMSEGFADFSASLFIQMIQKNNSEFIKFWNDERDLLIERNKEGFRAIDVGPVTQGYRLNTTRSGFEVTRRLIYPKGAYILHMIRMMMWSGKTGDDNFKAMMKDFVQTYRNRPASTEDFKAMVEKHMTPQMDVTGNQKMDWFFDEYVYGTALPSYHFAHSFEQAGNDLVLNIHVTQSGVDDKFTMLVPLYLEFANGKVVRIANASIQGNRTVSQKLTLGPMRDRPKRAMINYFNDVLAAP